MNRIVRGEVVERMGGGMYKMHFAGEPAETFHEVPACAGQTWTPGTVLRVDVTDPQRMHILAAGPGSQRKMRTIPAGVWHTAAGTGGRQRWTQSVVPADLSAYDATWEAYTIPAHTSYLAAGPCLIGDGGAGCAVYSTADGSSPWDASDWGQIWWTDGVYVYGRDADGKASKVVVASGSVVWAETFTPTIALPLAAESTASTMLIVGDQDLSGLHGISTVDGSTAWSISGTTIVPSGARIPDDNTAWVYSSTLDAVLVRYAVPGDPIHVDWPRPDDGFASVRYGRELVYHVRAFAAADGSELWDVVVPVTGQAGGAYTDEAAAFNVAGAHSFFRGATCDANGDIVFTMLGWDGVEFRDESPFIYAWESRTVYLCKVGGANTATPLDSWPDYQQNWLGYEDQLVLYLGARHVAGYDQARGHVVLWAPGVASFTTGGDYRVPTATTEVHTFSARPLTLAAYGSWTATVTGTSSQSINLVGFAIGGAASTTDGPMHAVALLGVIGSGTETYSIRHVDMAGGSMRAPTSLGSGAASGSTVNSGGNFCLHRGRLYLAYEGQTHRF